MRYRIKLTLLLLIIVRSGFAQGPVWITYDSSNSGLPENYVPSIAIDNFNNKWFGTVYSGVAKFDNTSWNVFNSSNSGLAAHNVQCIYIDSLNNKWFGSGWLGYISKFNDFTWTVYDSASSGGILVNYVGTNDIIVDKNGDLLIGTTMMGVKSFNGTVWSNVALGTLWYYLFDLAKDENNNLWVGYGGSSGNGGSTWYDGSTYSNYTTSNSPICSDEIKSIAVETNGTVWMASRYDGISKFNGSTWTNYSTVDIGLPDDAFNEVIIDQNNIKWFATPANGLLKFNDTSWTNYNISNSLIPGNDLLSLAIDPNNNLWVGTLSHGVGVFNENGVVLSVGETRSNEIITSCNPNPFTDNFTILSKANGSKTVTIFAADGKIIFSHTFANETEMKINTNKWDRGIYFVRIAMENSSSTHKIVK